MSKFIITGGPCCGKTSVINELKRRGFEVIPEAAEKIISGKFFEDGGSYKDSHKNNFIEFQRKIFDLQVEMESAFSSGIAFLDRSAVDGLAYFDFMNVECPFKQEIIDYFSADKIFVLDLLDNFERTEIRKETSEEGKIIHDLIQKNYSQLGHEIIFVPAMPISERVDFILSKL